MPMLPSNLPIIYYHSVGPVNPNWNRNYLTLDLAFFEDQLKYFSKHFKVISLDDYYNIVNGLSEPIPNALVITFDDGYLDNWIWAYPLIKKYGLKATIFVSPEYVDQKNGVRPNLEDFWNKNASGDEIRQWGYLNWDEMRIMQNSGIIDIESHTMTHTKYPVSDKIVGFHHPASDSLYTIANLFPEKKPYHISDPSFQNSLPFGYPIFEEASAVNARKVFINPEFINDCVDKLKNHDLTNYAFDAVKTLVDLIYQEYQAKKNMVISRETDSAYQSRVTYEVATSKKIIGDQLGKTVNFLCWPHGDNNQYAHDIAIKAGYKATTCGKMKAACKNSDRIPYRIGTSEIRNNRLLTHLRAAFKIRCAQHRFPYYQAYNIYLKVRYNEFSD